MQKGVEIEHWRIILAFFLDLLTAFILFGYAISRLFGGATEKGFSLQGWPAVLLFGAVVIYFLIFNRFFGGTLWDRILIGRIAAEGTQVARWRIILAFILDFVTIGFVSGYVISFLFGSASEQGFSLKGGSAFLLFATIIAYFVVFNRFLGGTIWKRILGAVR